MRSGRLILPLILLAAGCTHAAAPATPAPTAAAGDPALYKLLEKVPMDSAAEVALQDYELEASLNVRYNAVRILGVREAAAYVPSLRAALSAREPQVRAAAVTAAGLILNQRPRTGLSVVLAALDDPAPQVQGKALEVLGTRDLAVLRDFLARHPKGEAATIARGLLQAGEDRGAPLASDLAGVLRRATAGGLTLEFRPARSWPQWQAAVGTVSISGQKSPLSIPDIEAVADVVPVFFAPDESAIVYEQNRHIYVRALRSGEVREVGAGIAPRPLPFTEDFIYFRPDSTLAGELREQYKQRYDILRAGFTPKTQDPRFLGKMTTTLEMKQHGNYSPARWVRVVENQARFTLEGTGAETFRLPDPFKPDSTT
jgi:hypothetical protein